MVCYLTFTELHSELIKAVLGHVVSSALFWVVKPDDGGVWSWKKRWPAVEKGVDEGLLDEFFASMAGQHGHIMGEKEHICATSQLQAALD